MANKTLRELTAREAKGLIDDLAKIARDTVMPKYTGPEPVFDIQDGTQNRPGGYRKILKYLADSVLGYVLRDRKGTLYWCDKHHTGRDDWFESNGIHPGDCVVFLVKREVNIPEVIGGLSSGRDDGIKTMASVGYIVIEFFQILENKGNPEKTFLPGKGY